MGSPVTLPIRPEDLTRTESTAATVHQTLGREVRGWVDDFGQALPSCTISGNTGWRVAAGTGLDGSQSFEELNDLVQHTYPERRQAAIDAGADPANVRLLFVDALDDFAWSVHPMQFVLRRSKSRPLLFQYNITLQALATSVDAPNVVVPNYGDPNAGKKSLASATSTISSAQSWVSKALSAFKSALSPIASLVSKFVGITASVFNTVKATIKDITTLVTGGANALISLAAGMAQAGLNIFRSIVAIANLPASLKAQAMRIAAAYNEVACIFMNALRPRPSYENYSGLYGASNCSSTTGGSAASAYAGTNVFQLMQPSSSTAGTMTVSSGAIAALNNLKAADPVLAPMAVSEINRNVSAVVSGVSQ